MFFNISCIYCHVHVFLVFLIHYLTEKNIRCVHFCFAGSYRHSKIKLDDSGSTGFDTFQPFLLKLDEKHPIFENKYVDNKNSKV